MLIYAKKSSCALKLCRKRLFWPDMVTVFGRTGDVPHPDWEIPVLVCRAAGGNEAAALPGAAIIACLQISIMLVDDMLDEDPRGEHLRRGNGPTANLAQAFQAAAFRLAASGPLSSTQQTAMTACLAKAALATAVGQHLDVQNLQGEENYWRVVAAKSTPFYGAAYQLGGILAGAESAVSDSLYQLGVLVGEIIQIEDDLNDAMQKPANADWRQGRNNLLILYASTAEYPERKRFLALRSQAADTQKLKEAQQLLISSGAVSYAAFHLLQRYQAAQDLLCTIPLPHPEILQQVLDGFAEGSLIPLLRAGGVPVQNDILRSPISLVYL